MSSVPSVELGVLGPLQVRQDGAPVAIPGAKSRAILTMLGLHHGSVVSADILIALLWGDDPPRTAAKALQTHISSLRRALGRSVEGVIVTQGSGWTLQGPEVDAARYKLAAKAGRDAAAAGDTSQAVARFEEALALWRGIPELPEGRRGTSEKTRWIEGYAALVEDRADALLATGRAAELIGELEGAVADAPLRERRWAQLMLALYRAGRQGEALGAFKRAQALLAEELGVDPGPDLRRLEAAIVAQDSALETPAVQHVPAVTRAVTFLLTDIEGSTAAWEADADAMAVALARHDELVEQVVTSRGGRLIKTRGEGDATFSVFERPSAAATAAIDLQEAISGEPWPLHEPMRVRVALHTGEVEFRDGDYFGRAVNRAARLRSLAAGGQILCSGATAELVIDSLPDDVVLADLGTRELRNLARPERVFELRLQDAVDVAQPALTEAPLERPALPAVLAGPGPFVGRVGEIAQLFSAWQTALSGATNAVLIAGEPGVGKTRLAGEWSQQAYDQGALVIYGRCDEDLGAPYQPFAEALRSLVPCLGPGKLRGLRGVEALLTLVPGLIDVLPDLPAPTRADPDTERYALFDAVVAVLAVTSTSAPVVLILDDLHWAAKPTLLLLRHLLRFGDQARVQILGTYRSTDLDRSHPLAAMLADLHRDGTASRIALSGLAESDVTTYVAEAGYHDEELARALASVTGGNPFFLIEALRHVEESGGQWDPSTLPQGIREAVSRRLSRLPAEANKALAAAAVVGSRFALDLVEHVVGEDLVDAFDEACKAGIVIEEPGGRYRFNHALVRQSLLAELPSVRRMRLHQRIAATLEEQPGADDELLAELAHHYFECAWAGNAAKAVEYCRRAADQAMARLAYEGAADLYDRALHALEELDEELSDRDEQIAVLLVARCEALLAAGDVASAVGAVSQLQEATRGSDRLAAWAACFDGQLSMLIHPDRLDEAEAAVSTAAAKLAELGDTAGEAKAHTVRAGCLARLGRIGDCEVALDDALTAARRAREHRRVNSVLANAPLAALWGPNPVPRAGGRCLDVVRLLRITTDSPAVEATSTRCQAVLEAFRGRAAAARRMIDSARRTVTELGLRHALFEVEQFAGIVELVVDDPAAAEPHLRKAYNGFRRMRLDADTAETAALLGRVCLVLDREDEADELCTESERLAGHALKASIAWRTLRAQLLSRGDAHDEARRVAEDAVSRAERTDLLVDHGDACLALAAILSAAGNVAGARAAAGQAASLYERKGAGALAEKARGVLGRREVPAVPGRSEAPIEVQDNACVQVLRRLDDAAGRDTWNELEQILAPTITLESRRKIVGFSRIELSPREWASEASRFLEIGVVRARRVVIATRGERLALIRTALGTVDESLGSPEDELLHLLGLDEAGRIELQMSFDIEDVDAARAELDAQHARSERALSVEPDNACARLVRRLSAAVDREAWDELEEHFAAHTVESRRKIVGFIRDDLSVRDVRGLFENAGLRHRFAIIAVRGERLALTRFEIGTDDASAGAPHDEMLFLLGLDESGRVALEIFFDIEDIDAATAELDAAHARSEGVPPRVPLENAASRADDWFNALFADRRWDEVGRLLTDDIRVEDRRRGLRREGNDRASELAELRAIADVGTQSMTSDVLAIRGEHLALVRTLYSGRDQRPDAFHTEVLRVAETDADERIAAYVAFDPDDFEAAMAELDARYLAGEAAPYTRAWSVITGTYASISRHEFPAMTPDCVTIDHRRATAFAPGELPAYIRAGWELGQDVRPYVEMVHRLNDLGAVCSCAAHGVSHEGFDAEWRHLALSMIQGDMVNRCEFFDEADLDAAIARFAQLSRPTPRLENAASHVAERLLACFEDRDWDKFAEILADDISTEDRRRVVNAGTRQDRDAEIKDFRLAADLEVTTATTDVIAIRGERLVLIRSRLSRSDEEPEAFQVDLLWVIEIDTNDQIVAWVTLEPNDFDAAMAELDARYVAGEAAANSQTWSAIAAAYADLNRQKLFATTPEFEDVDHRRAAPFAPGDLVEYLRAAWDLGADVKMYVDTVHQVTDLGAVVTHTAHGTSNEGSAVEWHEINLVTVDGDRFSRCELFDEADLGAALARFAELHPQAKRLDNAAMRVCERLRACFAAREWDALADMLADDATTDDRRRVVGEGIRIGRDAVMTEISALAEVGVKNTTSEFIATRGSHLVLRRFRTAGRDQRPEQFHVEVLDVIEINADERVTARLVFDPDDFDAAVAELDARYLAGEAAPFASTWAAVTGAYAAFNRHEIPATPDWVNVDHRRATTVAPGGMAANIRATWDVAPNIRRSIEAVHRLDNLGAVVTHTAYGTSQEGFDAEWRLVALLTFAGDLIDRAELFDETDLDDALAKFEELSLPTPQLQNAAFQVAECFIKHFTAADWDAMGEMLADNFSSDDRRRVVGAGVRHGRDAEILDMQAISDIWVSSITSTIVATRGTRLVLVRAGFSDRDHGPEAFLTDVLGMVEIDTEEKITALLSFDSDDFTAAIAELDARYLAGEAAGHSHTWSLITAAFDAINRHELPELAPDWVNIDNRRGASFATGDMTAYLRDLLKDAPDINVYSEVVHRLSDLGAVITQKGQGTSQEGFQAEWREIGIFTFDGDLLSRYELFDEADLDAALAKFDQLNRPAPKLENEAGQAYRRLQAYFAARDWDAIDQMLADRIFHDDRRRMTGSGLRKGRDAAAAEFSALADIGVKGITSDPVATRGRRLILSRSRVSGRDRRPDAFRTDGLTIVEVDAEQKIAALLTFDSDDFEAASAELDTRYLAGEAATYRRTWSVIAGAYASINRHELPTTTPDWVNVDHRRAAAFAPGEAMEFIQAAWDLTQDQILSVEEVHRLSDIGAVVTHTSHGTSREGFDADWRFVNLFTVDGDKVSRTEIFDEADLDAAIAKFEQLSLPTPRLANAATRAWARLQSFFDARDWDAMAQIYAEDHCHDDRRRITGGGIRRGRNAFVENMRVVADLFEKLTVDVIAIRGDRLVLGRVRFWGLDRQPQAFLGEMLCVVETNFDDRWVGFVAFDPDDVDAAFAELETRYLAGDAAEYAHTWSAVTGGYAALNRHELPATTPDWLNIDHRRGMSNAPDEIPALLGAAWEDASDLRHHVEKVHRLNELGAVVTHIGHEISAEGFHAEWRAINVVTFDGDMMNRCEIFDEADLDTALATFDQLNPPAPRIENRASRIADRVMTHFTAREWNAATELIADDFCSDDRRRTVNAGIQRGRAAAMKDAHANADLGAKEVASTVVATRGERLVLRRARYSSSADRPDAFYVEALTIYEISGDGRLVASVVFEIDDIAAAFEELETRYRAGEAAPHSATWFAITQGYGSINRGELPPTTSDWVNIDHRRYGTSFAPGQLPALLASWDLAPGVSSFSSIEVVHRLNNIGAVVSTLSHETAREGVNAEWRVFSVITVEGGLIDRLEVFDEADLGAALTRFDELHQQTARLENAASRTLDRYFGYFGAHDWVAIAETLTDDSFVEDRNYMVNAGFWDGRDAVIANLQALEEAGAHITFTVIATRGERLVLIVMRSPSGDVRYGEFDSELLILVESDTEDRIARQVVFNCDDLDAAFAELDKRYLSGEAATNARTWSVIAGAYASLNRSEMPPTTTNFADIDHRSLGIASGDLMAYLGAGLAEAAHTSIYVEAVHRLTDLGAVVTHTASRTSNDLAAEWRMTDIFTVQGDLLSRCEIFDEKNLDAALARFEELRPTRQLENAASRASDRYLEQVVAQAWDAVAEMLADDYYTDDRRPVVGGGLYGRDAEIASVQAQAKLGATHASTTVIAVRGDHLALSRVRYSGRAQGLEVFVAEMLIIFEINADDRFVAAVAFDLDDINAAFAELDKRYLAGDAAAHAHTWSVIVEGFKSMNRHEVPATTTDFVDIDHRPLGIPSGGLGAYLRAAWGEAAYTSRYVEAVHRLTDLGAVVTHAASGTSLEDFEAEWRITDLLTVEGDLLSRCELFDETNLDAALARFEELHERALRLENAASRVAERFLAHFATGGWDEMADILADDFTNDDRRRVVGAGLRHGRDREIADMRTVAELWATSVTSAVIATRAKHLALLSFCFLGNEQGPERFRTELFSIVEINTDEHVVNVVSFDLDDIDAAFEELDRRYLAGEAAAHAHTWLVNSRLYDGFNRQELPATTPDWIYIDHRPLITIESNDLSALTRASWEQTPDIRIYMEAVHRLTDLGAVVTSAVYGSSQEGFQAEWRMIDLFTVQGDLISRCEIFDEADLDAALARFEELQPQATRLENAASQLVERFQTYFAARNWAAIAENSTAEIFTDDRRSVVGSGTLRGRDKDIANIRAAADLGSANLTSEVIAIRGARLALARLRMSGRDQRPEAFNSEMLGIVELDADNRVTARILFDLGDIDAAFEELERRYLAGEGAAHSQTWSVIADMYAQFNRQERPPTTPEWIHVDHRAVMSTDASDLPAHIRAGWDLITSVSIYVEAVHRLTDFGVVVTHIARGASPENSDVEWRIVNIFALDGDVINRCEFFDEADLNAALARFNELSSGG